MRILHINKYAHERDGVGRYMHDVMRLADAHGHATAVLAMQHPHNAPSVWEDFFVSNLETNRPGKGFGAVKQFARTLWSREAYQKTRAIIRAFRPDVIHAHNLYTHLSPSVLAAAHREGIPVVLTAHDYGYLSANYGLFDGRAPLAGDVSWSAVIKTKCIKNSALATAVVDALVRTQKALGMWTRGVTHILTASNAVKRALVAGGYDASRICVVPLMAGVLAHAEEPVSARRERRVVFASRFEAYKGVDVVMDLAARMSDVDFVCVGQGSGEEPLRRYASQQNNLTVRATLPPRELWNLMQTSAAVLVPSRWPEPFGLVALESLALGTPAIVSSEGGLPEIVEHGVSGFVEHPGVLDAWERDIRTLLPDASGKWSKTQQECGEEAQKRGRKVGDPEVHWSRLQAIYTEAIHQKEQV